MKKGQLIRRMLNNGTPVGAYMCIDRFSGTHVVAHTISRIYPDNIGDDEFYITRPHVYEVKVYKLIIGKNIWERINEGRQHSIIHDICPKWEDMMDKEPELVQLRAFNYPNKVLLFRVDQIKYVWYNRERQIRLDFGERIL